MEDLNYRAISGPAMEVWKRILSQIPTQFGRLVFIAGLRNASGQYSHRTMVEALGLELTDRALAHSHHSIFAAWIATSLSAQKADLDAYVRECGSPHSLEQYRELAPATAHDVERLLYITDLETLLTMLRYEAAAASSTRTA